MATNFVGCVRTFDKSRDEEDIEADGADDNDIVDEGIAWLSSLEGELINIICCFFCKLLASNRYMRLVVILAEFGRAAGLIIDVPLKETP